MECVEHDWWYGNIITLNTDQMVGVNVECPWHVWNGVSGIWLMATYCWIKDLGMCGKSVSGMWLMAWWPLHRQTIWWGSTYSAFGYVEECVACHHTDHSQCSTGGVCFLSRNMSEHVSHTITLWHIQRVTTSTFLYLSHWCVINRSTISCHKISFSSLILNVTVGTQREFRI